MSFIRELATGMSDSSAGPHWASPAQHLETHSRPALAYEVVVLGSTGGDVDEDALGALAPCRSSIDHTHHDLAFVGQIRNPNDGSEWVTGVGGDHGRLVERDTAGRPLPLESRPVIGRQTLANLE